MDGSSSLGFQDGTPVFLAYLREISFVDRPQRAVQFLRVIVENLQYPRCPGLDIDLFRCYLPPRMILSPGPSSRQCHQTDSKENSLPWSLHESYPA